MTRDRSNPPGGKIHTGSTVRERLSAGFGTAEDQMLMEQQSQQHREWLKSKAGRKFLKSQNRRTINQGDYPLTPRKHEN